MPADFLPQFRRQLHTWLERYLADGRTPFRRVEETPRILTASGAAWPDLVLWINRDSMLAGAMILIPAQPDLNYLAEAAELAGSLGLRQFVTWEARVVNLREVRNGNAEVLTSWPLPDAGTVQASDFSAIFSALLNELMQRAVSAALQPSALPATLFANLCYQSLLAIQPLLYERSRIMAGIAQSDDQARRRARDKGWMTIWRLLVLLWHDRLPPGVDPERLDRALAYAVIDLPVSDECRRWLAPEPGELPLPEPAAVRCHQLSGRLTQLGWRNDPSRAAATVTLLVAEVCRDCGARPLDNLAGLSTTDLLVGYLPPATNRSAVILPGPCLAGMTIRGEFIGTTGFHPTWTEVTDLPETFQPLRIMAWLGNHTIPSGADRRRRLAALRKPWPYRRFPLPAAAPAWMWDALHLGGIVDPCGELSLTLPVGWDTAPGAGILWQALAERLAPIDLTDNNNGGQMLRWRSLETPATCFIITCSGQPELKVSGNGLTLADLTEAISRGQKPLTGNRTPAGQRQSASAEAIAAEVFRDGLPRFPQDYLRRIDLPPLREYPSGGVFRQEFAFFGRIRLVDEHGTVVEVDDEITAEAFLMASREGQKKVSLPIDPLLTCKLVAAYRADLERLWQHLVKECRRHQTRPRTALNLARKLWQERGLPDPASSPDR